MSSSDADTIKELVEGRAAAVLSLAANEGYFGEQQGADLELEAVEFTELTLSPDGEQTIPSRDATATVIVTTPIQKHACNHSHNAHGGYMAWLIDWCSSMPLVVLQGADSWRTAGVTTSLTIFYHRAAPDGSKVRVISKVLHKESGKLIATATHVKADNWTGSAKL
ncbi:hypothetical protein MNV49_006224 [Pseudohyphozyma bogoriensis]|nr:hypothetical protein MNV49_006224 [Pseudohyphozyma bogoriensis]